MKTFEWVIAITLVIMGLICMTVSGTFLMNPGSIQPYLHTLFRLCLWTGLPIVIVGIIFLLVKRKRGNKK